MFLMENYITNLKNEGDLILNNIDKSLNILKEGKLAWHPKEDDIEEYAEKYNVSWGEAEKVLIKNYKEIQKKNRKRS